MKRLKQFVGMLAAAGVHTTTFTWEPEGVVYSTGKAVVRGNATGRYVDAARLSQLPRSVHADSVSEETLWRNLEQFVRDMEPVCRQHHVRMLLHPNDPPLPSVCGLPCLMRTAGAFDRVFAAAADSPWIGMEFCCGTWMEGLQYRPHTRQHEEQQRGGEGFEHKQHEKGAGRQETGGDAAQHTRQHQRCNAEDVARKRAKTGREQGMLPSTAEALDACGPGQFGVGQEALLGALADFVSRGKVGIVHLRNTTGPLPRFAETFVDDGYVDVFRIAQTLVRVGYTGTVILDHTPPFSGEAGERCATSFSIGYIKACIRAAQASGLP